MPAGGSRCSVHRKNIKMPWGHTYQRGRGKHVSSGRSGRSAFRAKLARHILYVPLEHPAFHARGMSVSVNLSLHRLSPLRFFGCPPLLSFANVLPLLTTCRLADSSLLADPIEDRTKREHLGRRRRHYYRHAGLRDRGRCCDHSSRRMVGPRKCQHG